MIFYLKNTKVVVGVPAYQGRLNTKFEENRLKLFPDMNEQTFEFPPPYPSSYTPIQLKLGTLVGRPGAIIVINFGENLY